MLPFRECLNTLTGNDNFIVTLVRIDRRRANAPGCGDPRKYQAGHVQFSQKVFEVCTEKRGKPALQKHMIFRENLEFGKELAARRTGDCIFPAAPPHMWKGIGQIGPEGLSKPDHRYLLLVAKSHQLVCVFHHRLAHVRKLAIRPNIAIEEILQEVNDDESRMYLNFGIWHSFVI